MKALLFALLLSASLGAQDLQFFIDSTNAPLSAAAPYQFPDTPAGQSSSIVVRITNTSTTDAFPIAAVFLSASASTSITAAGFTITGAPDDLILPPQSAAQTNSVRFTVTFSPVSTGPVSAYLLLQSQQNGSLTVISPLQGNGTAPQLELSCSGCSGTSINFGTVAVGSSQTISLTLNNASSSAITTPAIGTPQNTTFATPQFSVNSSALPGTIAANSSVSFPATFTPTPDFSGTSNTVSATLQIGSQSYTMQGIAVPPTGTPVNSDGLQVKFTDETGAQINGSTLQLGPVPTSLILTCTVLNPNPSGTELATITLPTTPAVSTSAFTLGTFTLAPSVAGVSGSSTTIQAGNPVAIPPGWALTFPVSLAGTESGTATATLTIPGVITYTLDGQAPPALGSAQSDLPGITMYCGASPCTSQSFTGQQQVQASLKLSTPSSGSATLALAFSPSVSGVKNDPAVTFIAPFNSLQIGPINFSQSSTTGTFAGGASQFTFQTGTTAGTLAFTLTDAVTQQTLVWKITIPPAPIQITSGQAVSEVSQAGLPTGNGAPAQTVSDYALIVTLTGYDNTYSASELSFTFYAPNGSNLTPGGLSINAASEFHQYFFTNDTAGGAFSVQASFPLIGDPAQVGSVTVTLTNSAGQTSNTQTFQ